VQNVLLTSLPFFFSPLPHFYYFLSPIFSSFILSSTILLFSLLIPEFPPSPQFWSFPTSSSFLISLLHNFYYFPSSIFLSLLYNFYYLPSSISISLLLHLLIYSLYFSIHKYIDPTSTLDSTYFQHCFVNSETIYNRHHISFSHHHHISVAFSPPPHFYSFHSSHCFPARKIIWVWLFWPEFGLLGLILAILACLVGKQ